MDTNIDEIKRDAIEMNLSDIEINQLYPIAIEESNICPDAIVIESENVDTIFYSDDNDYTQQDSDYTEQDNDNIEHNNDNNNNNHDDDENTKCECIFIIFGLSIIIIFLGMIIFMYLF